MQAYNEFNRLLKIYINESRRTPLMIKEDFVKSFNEMGKELRKLLDMNKKAYPNGFDTLVIGKEKEDDEEDTTNS
jgi:hypothetical protein